jgi:hypothetical protein
MNEDVGEKYRANKKIAQWRDMRAANKKCEKWDGMPRFSQTSDGSVRNRFVVFVSATE